MNVFIAWSGQRSSDAAQFLYDWLPVVIQSVKPFMSSESIRKGSRWSQEISQSLSDCSFGILCLTSENLQSEWIHFEAGALSKVIGDVHVVPLLIGISATDVQQPLAQFQSVVPNRDEILKLLRTINEALGDGGLVDAVLVKSFDSQWGEFETKIAEFATPSERVEKHGEQRSDRSLLEEVVGLVRDQSRSLSMFDDRIRHSEYSNRRSMEHEFLRREAEKVRRDEDRDASRGAMNDSVNDTWELFEDRLLRFEGKADGKRTLYVLQDHSKEELDHDNLVILEERFGVPFQITYLTPKEFSDKQREILKNYEV